MEPPLATWSALVAPGVDAVCLRVLDLEYLNLALPDGLTHMGFVDRDRLDPDRFELMQVMDRVNESGQAGGVDWHPA